MARLLTGRYRQVIELRFLEGFKLSEIAALYEFSEARASQVLSDALALLKKKLRLQPDFEEYFEQEGLGMKCKRMGCQNEEQVRNSMRMGYCSREHAPLAHLLGKEPPTRPTWTPPAAPPAPSPAVLEELEAPAPRIMGIPRCRFIACTRLAQPGKTYCSIEHAPSTGQPSASLGAQETQETKTRDVGDEMAGDDLEGWLSASELAEQIGVSVITLYKWVKDGLVTGEFPTGKRMKFKLEKARAELEHNGKLGGSGRGIPKPEQAAEASPPPQRVEDASELEEGTESEEAAVSPDDTAALVQEARKRAARAGLKAYLQRLAAAADGARQASCPEVEVALLRDYVQAEARFKGALRKLMA